jgi:hypothetical protein
MEILALTTLATVWKDVNILSEIVEKILKSKLSLETVM